jgi:choline dehydrogenase-like flavoprotein
MAGFDYDAVVIGSGFGGSVAAFRAAEKGYGVGVMESGKRWNDEDLPLFDCTEGSWSTIPLPAVVSTAPGG